ncbi:MAG: hypothetical protein ACOX68_07830 [Candidatus Limivicinus sp.]|jgi:hypothetical protein
MELLISDVSSLCFSDNIDINSSEELDMTERIRASVMAQISDRKPVKHRKFIRIFLIAAAAAALLTTAAFAISSFVMNKTATDEAVSGRWTKLDDEGNIIFDQEVSFPDAGMVFTFTGSEERHNEPEFRAFWLPECNITGVTDEGGWTSYLCDEGKEGSLPFLIQASGVIAGNSKFVLNGDVNVISEEEKDGWEITKLVSDYTDTSIKWDGNKVNYVLMFNPEMGYLVRVGGTSDMEIIEKIADNLEIRESDRPPFESGVSENIGMLDIGRG